ncbi:MAG: FlgO family outer membrane protein, partial [Pseudomonadales bacterium]|nr:FlgO family outer membrane protein [Pseudomonadales bacterium]
MDRLVFLFRVFSVSVAVTLSLFTVAVAGAQTITRVAIGPFENRSGIAEDDWLGQGLAESVATDVRANGLVVVDLRGLLFRDTSEQVEDRVETVALTEARARGAAWLVMGSYQRVTDQVRIIVRFVHVETGIVARRANIDGVIGRLFELQDEIAPILVDVISAGVNRNASRQVAAIDARGGGTLPTNAQQRPMPRGGLAARPAGDVPTTIIQPTSEPPRIDGRLDDPVWASATHITDFVQIAPVAGAPGTEATEVWMAYDRDNLYFAFYAHYTDPSIIRINRTDRDEALGDDQMAVLFDPFLDQQRAYQFEVNGYGVQGDSLVNADGTGRSRGSNSMSMVTSSLGASYWQRNSGSGMSMSGTFGIRGDSSWNALFETAGELVEDGWTAEMAIPFKSLRYPARAEGESHRWGFQITRRIRGRSEAQSWSPISRDIQGNLTQFGILEGLEEL